MCGGGFGVRDDAHQGAEFLVVFLREDSVIRAAGVRPQICLEERQRNSAKREALERLDVYFFDAAECEDGGGVVLLSAAGHAVRDVELAGGEDGAVECGFGTVAEEVVDFVAELFEEEIVVGAVKGSLADSC